MERFRIVPLLAVLLLSACAYGQRLQREKAQEDAVMKRWERLR